jgi:hypothetical protein
MGVFSMADLSEEDAHMVYDVFESLSPDPRALTDVQLKNVVYHMRILFGEIRHREHTHNLINFSMTSPPEWSIISPSFSYPDHALYTFNLSSQFPVEFRKPILLNLWHALNFNKDAAFLKRRFYIQFGLKKDQFNAITWE